MPLPFDSHVHSEFSWDTGGPTSPAAGRMLATCERAVELGLPGLALTDHLDVGSWPAAPSDHEEYAALITDGRLTPPPFDLAGYLDAVDRCRHRFPDLRILTGCELGQPHVTARDAAAVVDLTTLDRVIGSLHTLPIGPPADDGAPADRAEPNHLFTSCAADDVMLAYCEEMVAMVAGPEPFAVVTHLDYAVRTWPTATAGPFDPARFEEPLRAAMRAIARSGRALEMSAWLLQPWMPRWWAEEGGREVSFASDAHEPDALGARMPEAVALVEAHGFRPGPRPEDLWRR